MDEKWDYAPHLLQSWMVGYERAIMSHHFNQSKKVTDEACYHAVEDFTQRLFDSGKINKILGKELHTMTECINHHVDNLIKVGLRDEAYKPMIEEVSEFEIVIKVPHCPYKEGCKWALGEESFSPVQAFRCQNIGTSVGAIKKYLAEDVMPPDMKPDYFMTRVHEEDGCSGVVFGRRGFQYRLLLQKYGLQQKKESEE
jgi:hypothetical protein